MNRRIRINKDAAKHMEAFGEKGYMNQPAFQDSAVERPFEKTLVPAGHPRPEPAAPAEEMPGIVVAGRTDMGKVRSSNQDALILCGALVGVADGMGGHNGGEVASAGTRDLIREQLEGKAADPKLLQSAVRIANKRMFLRAQDDPSLTGMGTTLDLIWFGSDEVYAAHVGDSRIYLMRDDQLKQITDDHSMVMEMFRAGLITLEQAQNHPMKNIITRAVATESIVEVDMITTPRKKGDIWLVCSDGLHGMVDDEKIADILRRYAPEEAASELLKQALAAGGRDNVTLVVALDGEGADE